MRIAPLLLLPWAFGCLPYSPFDPGLCRSGSAAPGNDFFREEGGLLLIPEDLSDELRRCSKAGTVRLEGDLATADLGPIGNLREVSGLGVFDTRGLSSLGAFGGLEVVTGHLVVSGNLGLSRLSLGGLERVERALVFERNPVLPRCEARALAQRLETASAFVLSGGQTCAEDPERLTGFAVAPASAVLSFAATPAERLLLVRGGRSLSVSSLDAQPIATATSSDGRGAMLSSSHEGNLSWAVFVGGEWPIEGSDDGARLRLAADGQGGVIYVGWVSARARVASYELEGPGFWFGRISASGVVSPPDRLLPFQSGVSPKLPVALAPNPAGGFAFVFRAGSALGLAPVDEAGRVGTSWFAPTPAAEGPVEVRFVRPVADGRWAVGVRRSGPGDILLRGELLPGEPIGFVAVFDTATGAVQSDIQVLDEQRAPTCIDLEGGSGAFLGGGSARLELRGAGAQVRTVDFPDGVDPAALRRADCRLGTDALFTGAASTEERGFSWRLGRFGESLVVEDLGRFDAEPGDAHFVALPDGGAALAVPSGEGLSLEGETYLDFFPNSVIVLGRPALPRFGNPRR